MQITGDVLLVLVIAVVALVLAIVITRLMLLRTHEPAALRKAAESQAQTLQHAKLTLQAQCDNTTAQLQALQNRFTTIEAERNMLSAQLAAEGQLAKGLALQIESLKGDKANYQHKWEQSAAAYIELQNNYLRSKTQLEEERKRLEQQQEHILGLEQKMGITFEALASKALEAKTQSFALAQAQEFTHLVAPLKQELADLKTRLEGATQQASAERNTMFGQVKEMLLQTNALSQQADNLANALKGQSKQQGDWGEWILESILEYSGLTKNKEYFIQQSDKNEAGHTIRPDVVIKYPDNRVMIVDSKVTLVGYDRVVGASNAEVQKLMLVQLIKQFKTHIDGLSGKNYQQAKDALDFVVMFVPVEGAYIAVMQADANLWKYAYDKRILLLSPTNLIAALKLVHNMWQRDDVNKNAEAIADRAAKLYDKLVGFVESFEAIGKALDKAQNIYGEAKAKMIAGNDNLLLQGQKMEKLQKRKGPKQLPPQWVEGLDDDTAN
jgi:DNA recombination protein RmuC